MSNVTVNSWQPLNCEPPISRDGIFQQPVSVGLEHLGLTVPLDKIGYYETDRHKELFKNIRNAIIDGKLIALCGLIGSGKTITFKRLQAILEDDKKVSNRFPLTFDREKHH